MKYFLAQIKATRMFARDWHYNAKGRSFYAEHLLADLVLEKTDGCDALIEAYYLGDRRQVPPTQGEITTLAQEYYATNCDAGGNERSVLKMLGIAQAHAEELSRGSVSNGIKSLLDGYSERLLSVIGLLERTLEASV